jgi:AraC-like DNA-binding protein
VVEAWTNSVVVAPPRVWFTGTMRVEVIAPSPRLAPFVRQFTVVEAQEETTRVLVPDGGIVIGFRYSGSSSLIENGAATRLPNATFAGMRDTVRHMRTSAGGGVVLAVFHEGGAAPFLAPPLHELFGASLALDALLPRGDIEEVNSRVEEATDLVERVKVVEEFLLARQALRRPDPVVAAAVRAIRAAPGTIRIGPLAAHLGFSQDRLEKRFRRSVGASPKQLASILRLRRAVDSYRPGASLTRLAADAGYFDQSHFIREFRSVTGKAPQEFFGPSHHC